MIIPTCSKSKKLSSITLPFFNIPLPKTNDVELSVFVSRVNLFVVLIYSNEYGTGTSAI